jgi:hypothetical protein
MILKFTLSAILSEEYGRSRNHNQIRQATAERCRAPDVHYQRVTQDRCALRNAVSSSQLSLNLELFAFRILITLR